MKRSDFSIKQLETLRKNLGLYKTFMLNNNNLGDIHLLIFSRDFPHPYGFVYPHFIKSSPNSDEVFHLIALDSKDMAYGYIEDVKGNLQFKLVPLEEVEELDEEATFEYEYRNSPADIIDGEEEFEDEDEMS